MRQIGTLTENEMKISRTLIGGQYSAKSAQMDLNKFTSPGEYIVDGDTYFGYEIRHAASKKVVTRNYSLRELVILVISLWESATEENN